MMLPFYLVVAAVLFPSPAAGQSQSFAVKLDVTVCPNLFACKDTSELDRLLQRNRSGAFSSGTQLYDYLKTTNALVSPQAARACTPPEANTFASTIRKTIRRASIPVPGREGTCCREFCESSAAPGGEDDAALLSSFGDGSFPTSSGWTEPIFYRQTDVTVRANSSACKETSELDRLLQRNQSGGFTSGTQLYDYLKAHKCMGLTAGRARVYSTRGQYVCIYDPKDNKTSIYPCAWTRTEMLSK